MYPILFSGEEYVLAIPVQGTDLYQVYHRAYYNGDEWLDVRGLNTLKKITNSSRFGKLEKVNRLTALIQFGMVVQ